MDYKSIQIDKDVYDKLAVLASDNGKKIKQTVREMVDLCDAHQAAFRLLFSSDPDIVSRVIKAWCDQTREEMVKGLTK